VGRQAPRKEAILGPWSGVGIAAIERGYRIARLNYR
jgi:hypothetical protein